MTERRPITLADVAAEAQVHAATVSRVLSRPDLVRDTTAQRVLAAVDRLDYVPNRAARQLAGGRTASLAMLVPDIANPFFAQVLQAAQHRAREADHLVLLADTGQHPRHEVEAVRSLAPHVGGIIICSPVASVRSLRDAAGNRPLLFVNRRSRDIPSVVVDQRPIITAAVEHLRGLGHERIVAVPGPAGYWSTVERAREVSRRGDVVALDAAEPTFDGGRRALPAVLAHGATAVVAFNDLMALGLVAAATERGLRIPGDLSVVGSDDVRLASMATPALTTVAAPLDLVASLAVEVLLAVIEKDLVCGRAPATHRVVAPHLVVRATTAALR